MKLLWMVLALAALTLAIVFALRGRGAESVALDGVALELGVQAREEAPAAALERKLAAQDEREPARSAAAVAPEAPPPASAEHSGRVKVAGRVFHRDTREPVTGGRIFFDFAPAPAHVQTLERLDDAALAAFATETLVKQLDDEGRFVVHLDADAWVMRARIEPPKAVQVAELKSTTTHVQLAGFVATTRELRKLVRELELPLWLEVDSGTSISGRVVDALDGAGIEDVWITTRAVQGSTLAARSDAKGEFVLSGLGDDARRWLLGGPLELDASHPLYVTRSESVALPEGGTSVVGLEIALTAGITLAGVVLDAEGSGVSGVLLEARAFSARGTGLGRTLTVRETTISSAQGWFEFSAVPASRELELAVGGRHAVGAESLIVDGTQSHTDLALHLGPSRRFQVRVLSPSGEELDAARLVVLVKVDGASAHVVPLLFDVAGERAFDLEVFATPSELKTIDDWFEPLGEHWYGRTRVLPVDAGGETRELELRLERRASANSPPPGPGMRVGCEARPFAQRTFDLLLLDASAGIALPEGTRLRVETTGSMSTALIGADSRLRLDVGLGTRVIEFAPTGYEPLRIEIEALAPGHEEVTLTFERQRP